MVAVLFNAGDQVPVIPFNDVVGNALNAAPEQIGATALNTGVAGGFTWILTVTEAFAHWPVPGVNV